MPKSNELTRARAYNYSDIKRRYRSLKSTHNSNEFSSLKAEPREEAVHAVKKYFCIC